ncbi:uncharacterized protein LOC109837607 isoform X2 [Asparagus officinalis]|nr:uncharacterized protein LOC109837607 isoform X2 [Asparagus officinalis]
MHGCEEGSDNLNNQFSITEKMVMDACNICIELDSSKDNPIIQGWPISKVAVFLVDPTNKNCLLQFCSITQGVWSLVEKAVEAHYENGFSQNEADEFEKVLEQLAFSSVEQETGISRSDLSILERHLTYSLSHEKTTSRLYIMKYGRVLSEELPEVAIEDVITSLEGPLVKKDLTCEVTSVVEYYNILPYVEIIASWLSREDANHDSLNLWGQQVIKEGKCSLQPNGVASIADHKVDIKFVSSESNADIGNRKESKTLTIETSRSQLSSVNGSLESAIRPENIAGSPCIEQEDRIIMKDQAMNDKPMQNEQDNNDLDNEKNNLMDGNTYNNRVDGSYRVTNSCKAVDLKHPLVLDRMPMEDEGMNTKSDLSERNVNNKDKKIVKSERVTIKNINDLPADNNSSTAISKPKKIYDVSQAEPDSLTKIKDQVRKDKLPKTGQCEDIEISEKKHIKDASTSNEKSGSTCVKDAMTSKSNTLRQNSLQQPSHCAVTSGTNVTSDAYIDECKNDICSASPVSVGGNEDKACRRDSVGCITKCTDKDRTYVSGANQGGCSSGDLPLAPVHFTSSDHSSFYHVMASKEKDLLQACLRVFQKKRDDLYQQKRLIQDEIARCEMNIQKNLRGDESSTLQVDSVIEALNSLSSSQVRMGLSSEEQRLSQNSKRRKFSEAVLSSVNSCQELDDICHENGWILPRYTVFPSLAGCESTGMFKATVSVHGTDFEFADDGDLKSSPHEARESAATQMLNTLQTLQARIKKQ